MKALKPAKPKIINFELIPEKDGEHVPEPYRIMREMVEKYHEDLHGAKIAMAWRKNLKADKDGHLMLGMCVKASDLQKEFAEYDFVILLNREVWLSDEFTTEKKKALVDHELCHATFAPDKDGFKKRDERERIVWRVRKHDIEEFFDVVRRHGCYKRDLVAFADALMKKKATPPLIAVMQKDQPLADAMAKLVSNVDGVGITSMTISTDTDSVTITPETADRLQREAGRRPKRKLRGQDAILPDPRRQDPPAAPEA